jgi:hypothetical protein
LGIPQKNIFKKWQNFNSQNHALKSPQSTINPPQTHHEFTIKKHHIFANPLQKSPVKPPEIDPNPTSKKITKTNPAPIKEPCRRNESW